MEKLKIFTYVMFIGLFAFGFIVYLTTDDTVSKATIRQIDENKAMHQQISRETHETVTVRQAPAQKITEETTTVPETQQETTDNIKVYTHNINCIAKDDFNLMCRVVMSEAGAEPFATQLAVAETILNRVESQRFGNCISEVVKQPYAYSTHYNGEPTDSVQEAVTTALETQTYASHMCYFREDYYHEFANDYRKIGNLYFSQEAER